MGESDCIINAMIVGVVISLVIPRVLLMFARPNEIKPPLKGLTEKEKFMHLMAHKKEMPVLCAIIVASIVGVSVYLGYILKPMEVIRGK
jgi:hypothetical protein